MNIVWFRRDLRLADNESLSQACRNNAEVLPCLVVDPWLFEWREISPARLRFWFDSVRDLDRQLRAKGSRLILLKGRSRSVGFAESAEVSFSQRFYLTPEISYKNRFPEFDEWYQDAPLDEEKQQLFQAWQDGETGFPLIDASMRQLKVMGWMNFRMRAMCATFLTINCGISWHHGALHFMQHLVDGDLAIAPTTMPKFIPIELRSLFN
jgi:deoxyribodipyrimidine photolyase